MPQFRSFRVMPSIPERLQGLLKIAMNFKWCWDKEAIQLFRRVDARLWQETKQNPVKMLGMVDQRVLEELSTDDSFLAHLDRVIVNMINYMGNDRTWYRLNYKDEKDLTIAYFSLEFGLAECLPIYSGGLGVLSGDHLKSASDLGLPLVGVGLAYRLGYFRQYLNADGWQQETYPEIDFFNTALILEKDENNEPMTVNVEFPDGVCRAQIWRCQVGRVNLYMLDTNIPQNPPAMREVSSQLYIADREMRLRQEILLGVGGYRALKKLGIYPEVCHLNEGHSAFLIFERAKDLMESHQLTFDEAIQAVAGGSVFTTHTPVPAGNEMFDPNLVLKYLGHYCDEIKIEREYLLGLGRQNPEDSNEPFCMTILALRCANWRNGVSQLHGEVSRRMWSGIWRDVPEHDIPITSITNGVHVHTWISPDLSDLFDRYLGPRWMTNPADSKIWKRAANIPDGELWRTHERRRERLVAFARRRLRDQLKHRDAPQSAILEAEEVLNPEAFTIGYARRFATYKRGDLIFRNRERLAKIISNADRPVQIIIAGKSHPADNEAKKLISKIIHICRDEPFRHNVVFIEDYDMEVARYMTQGCDLWLNTPRRPLEASGTSGMKSCANAVLNMSIPDGWWCEGYRPQNGFNIGKGEFYDDLDYQDEVESNAIYEMLEKHALPMFYTRGRDGLPRDWIDYMKNCLTTIVPEFSATRMVREYTENFYIPAARRFMTFSENNFERSRKLAEWLKKLKESWNAVKVLKVNVNTDNSYSVGDRVSVQAELETGKLSPEDLAVEVYYGILDTEGHVIEPATARIDSGTPLEGKKQRYTFEGEMVCEHSGQYGFAIRVLPNHPDLDTPFLPEHIIWG